MYRDCNEHAEKEAQVTPNKLGKVPSSRFPEFVTFVMNLFQVACNQVDLATMFLEDVVS